MLAVIVPIGIGGLVFFGLWFWSILDTIATDSILTRNLPKETWLFVVILIPVGGALAWLLLGRPLGAGLALGGNYRPANYSNQSKARGFEDSTDWKARSAKIKPAKAVPTDGDVSESNAVKERRLLEWEAELAKREAALGDDPDLGPETEATD